MSREVTDLSKILAGREAVDAYREAHGQLYVGGWYKGISEDHTPLAETMLVEFKKQGFNTIQEFFDASGELNIRELGFVDRQDFRAKATDANREAIEGMWH